MHAPRLRALAVASVCALLCAAGGLVHVSHASPAAPEGEPDPEDSAKPAAPKPKLVGIGRIKTAERDGMVLVPSSRFPMGLNFAKAIPPNERPQRIVLAPSFWIDKTEVTVAAYKLCVDARHCERPKKSSALCTFDAGEADLPVSCVRWVDAEAYCRFARKRLPSEVEWELAARGPAGYVYPWGNRLPDCKLANTLLRDNSGRTCAPRPWKVGSVPQNASVYGVLDMSGNVEEWTMDWYAEHVSDVAPRSGASHTLRGGGFQSGPSRSRASTRSWGSSLEAGANVGFRCARDASAADVAKVPRALGLPIDAGAPKPAR